MMRVVDILYGLPYILLVVLMAVAVDGVVSGYMNRQFQQRDSIEQQKLALVAAAEAARNEQRIVDAEKIEAQVSQLTYEKTALMNLVEDYPWVINLFTLIIAIGGVSWLTMARVIRGQVLSLRSQPFVEAARALGVGPWRILRIHLLPNLIGPIVVYTTLTVPSAILQESFLSFLGIGVQPPMPSWGNLASDGLPEVHSVLNPHEDSRWWLLFWPCFLLGLTLMALNFLGDALRSRIDPKSRKKATA
jgi:oligopeptide transport system permease protein